MPYDDRTAYRLVFDDNGADMMTTGPGWCRASRVVRVEPDTGVRTSTMEGGLFRWDLLTKTTLMRLLLRSPFGVHSLQDTIGQDHDIHAPYYPRLESSPWIKFHLFQAAAETWFALQMPRTSESEGGRNCHQALVKDIWPPILLNSFEMILKVGRC